MTNPVPVVVCDDSKVARRSMVRALSGWNVEITTAEHGLEGLEAIRNGKGDLLFLDLNMPLMDGYDVLERIRRDDLPTMVIVVSGDVQPEARQRVLALGALDFIKKPFTKDDVQEVLVRFGMLTEVDQTVSSSTALNESSSEEIALPDYYQEVANIAMGRAGDSLSKLLHAFIQLPVPDVRIIDYDFLHEKFERETTDRSRMVSQGFIGSGLSGEALLILRDGSFKPLCQLMGKHFVEGRAFENELIMEMANTLIGAFLQNFAQLLDLGFSWGIPAVLHLGNHPMEGTEKWGNAFSISLDYSQPESRISCELILVFSEDSTATFHELGNYLR